MNGTHLHFTDSCRLLEEIAEFIAMLDIVSEEEAMNELRHCHPDVLDWILKDIAIPNHLFDLITVIEKITEQRTTTGSTDIS